MSPLRIAANVAGATAGMLAAEIYILPMLPGNFQRAAGIGLDDLVVGASAFAGAMLANLLLSKFSG